MKGKLLFLPIDIDIDISKLFDHKESLITFKGLWSTMIFREEHFANASIINLLNQLPFSKITQAKYNVQKIDVIPHIDVKQEYLNDNPQYKNICESEPSGYRIVLSGKPDSMEIFLDDQWKKVYLPSVPGAYLINSTELYHRILNDTGRRSLYFRGFIDKIKHEELIEKSLIKFSDYAVYSN
jgi:hypothetical protein